MVNALPIQAANLGMADSIILMVMALVVFGPRRLPQIGRQIGKLMYEFRKASNDFKFQMEEELRLAEEADRRKKEEAERLRVAALPAPAQTAPQTIEAAADIGAIESPSASPYSGEGQYPVQYPSETAAAAAEPVINIPRIQPPSTGEQVNAALPGHMDLVADGSEGNTAAAVEALSGPPERGAEPSTGLVPGPVTESDHSQNIETSTSPSEPVSQHG